MQSTCPVLCTPIFEQRLKDIGITDPFAILLFMWGSSNLTKLFFSYFGRYVDIP